MGQRQTRSEVQVAWSASAASDAKFQAPECRLSERRPIGEIQRAYEGSRRRIKGVDLAIAVIPNQEVVGESAKSGGCYGKPPGRIEGAGRAGKVDQALDEVPVQIEHVDKPVARPGDIVVLGGILQRVGDVELAVYELNVEGCPVLTRRRPKGDDGRCGSVKLFTNSKLELYSSIIPLLKFVAKRTLLPLMVAIARPL